MALTKKKAAAAAGPAPEAAAEPAAKKAPSAKSILKKTEAKKPVERVEEVFLQSGGTEWNVSDCKDRAIAAYVAEGHRPSGVKKLVLYLKPEEGKAYYVVNDSANGSVDL